MRYQFLKPVWDKIELIWQESGTWPEFVACMRQALPRYGEEVDLTQRSPLRWVLLPGLCCQAAGGNPEWAHPIAGAWLLFYVAAHIMDSVEDQDTPDPLWASLGNGAAINIASGLYFSASILLTEFQNKDGKGLEANLLQDFYSQFLVMCGGQHRDLTRGDNSIEGYWKRTREKSGIFFALACHSGASLATKDAQKLQNFRDLGRNLGIAVQILDDIEEFKPLQHDFEPGQYRGLPRSLPALYALEVLPEEQAQELEAKLLHADRDLSVLQEVVELIENSGAGTYMDLQLKYYQHQALKCLQVIEPQLPAGDALKALVHSLSINPA